MNTLRVDLGCRSYPIVVGKGVLKRAGKILLRLGLSSPPIIVTNSLIWRTHGAILRESLDDSLGSASVIKIGDGERFKCHDSLLKIYEGLFRAKADRRSWVLAFGGGVVGDIAGFAAATFMRGIPYVNVPTTLLAQVDSSIGGKVGINVPRGKNLIGAFHQPIAVLSDTEILVTLPARELASGLYEVVKCGAIRSVSLLRYIDRHLPAILERRSGPLGHVILESSRIKAEVVAGDEREQGLRMILNFGHTVGHALEAATSYRRFKHGEAVAWGMIAAVGFGSELGMLDGDEGQRLVRIIHAVSALPSLKGIRFPALWSPLIRDKKFRAGSIRMVLLPRLGATRVVADIKPPQLKRFLQTFLEAGGRVA
jgi:3-dehydroquinate synthase